VIVTDIIAVDNKKSKVYIDHQFAFVLYKGELRSYKIKQDSTISQEDYEEITQRLLPKRATKRAMNLLKDRRYTRHQLIEKLRAGDYAQNCIDAAIAYVEGYGYIDDLQYALDFITYRASQLNRRQIEQKLIRKGIDSKVIDQALKSFYDEGNLIEEEQQIRSFLRKKNYDDLEEDSKRQKVLAALMRKGYRYEQIRDAIRSYEQQETEL